MTLNLNFRLNSALEKYSFLWMVHRCRNLNIGVGICLLHGLWLRIRLCLVSVIQMIQIGWLRRIFAVLLHGEYPICVSISFFRASLTWTLLTGPLDITVIFLKDLARAVSLSFTLYTLNWFRIKKIIWAVAACGHYSRGVNCQFLK